MEKKIIMVEKTVYVTKDGKEFDTEKDALFHEDFLTGKKKHCKNCNGKGTITKQEESWVPGDGDFVEVLKFDICSKCEGKGYLELMCH